MKSLKYYLKLIKLTYITFPFFKEKDHNLGVRTSVLYSLGFLPIIMAFIWDTSNSFNYYYPSLDELQITSGVVVRDERTKGGGRRVSETFKIKTEDGQIQQFVCTSNGTKCFDNTEWDNYMNL